MEPLFFLFFGKGDPLQIGQTLRRGKSCLNRFGRSQSLTRSAGLQKRGTLIPLPLNCAFTFIHVSKLFSFWNWKEIE